jgi:hypothetical protein
METLSNLRVSPSTKRAGLVSRNLAICACSPEGGAVSAARKIRSASGPHLQNGLASLEAVQQVGHALRQPSQAADAVAQLEERQHGVAQALSAARRQSARAAP